MGKYDPINGDFASLVDKLNKEQLLSLEKSAFISAKEHQKHSEKNSVNEIDTNNVLVNTSQQKGKGKTKDKKKKIIITTTDEARASVANKANAVNKNTAVDKNNENLKKNSYFIVLIFVFCFLFVVIQNFSITEAMPVLVFLGIILIVSFFKLTSGSKKKD